MSADVLHIHSDLRENAKVNLSDFLPFRLHEAPERDAKPTNRSPVVQTGPILNPMIRDTNHLPAISHMRRHADASAN
ncbi:hypothetical protein BTO02_22770 [Paraburkholderia sp. SOS3]|nr:hypothetical protein BTO02_22770 [Paraburkholderia sp. SOS3]